MNQPINITAILRPAIYILRLHGHVAYIGKARCPLTALINHRLAFGSETLSRLFPHRAIHFDDIELIPCTLAEAPALHAALIELHQPRRQHPKAPATELPLSAPPPPPSRPERRI